MKQSVKPKFRKFKRTKQFIDALTNAEFNKEYNCRNQLAIYNFLYYKNREKGLTNKEAKLMRLIISFFNDRGKELKKLIK